MAKNHPLIKDVKNWILDSFSFMDAVGYDILFDDDIYGMENTKAISADIDGLTDFDFEKGKKNLLKSIPNKIKAEFPYLRITSGKDGDYFIMFIVLLDNNDYLEDKNISYINLNESKESARKSMKESSDVANTIASEIDKSYWIDKLINDLDKHYESMEKAWLKNLDKLSDEDILGIINDCMGKSKTLVGKSEILKNKMIDDLSKAYDDYIDDIDRQIRIGKSEDEIKDMIKTTLENDIKMYLKLTYNNKASSNYFMVKFAEDNLI